MITYSLHVKCPSKEDQFIQTGFSKEDLMKPRSTILRWVFEMSVLIPKPKEAVLVICQDGKPMFSAKYAGQKLTWRPFIAENR